MGRNEVLTTAIIVILLKICCSPCSAAYSGRCIAYDGGHCWCRLHRVLITAVPPCCLRLLSNHQSHTDTHRRRSPRFPAMALRAMLRCRLSQHSL